MKLGAIARADHRGLGLQSTEFVRWMRPERVLCVDATNEIENFDQHFDQIRDVCDPIIVAQGDVDHAAEQFLHGLDLVWSAETFYSWHLLERARVLGVKTVLHANPEFYPYERQIGRPRPDVVWNPSTWRLDYMPGAEVVPFPVDRQRLPYRHRARAKRFLHVVGRPAIHDRAGTATVLEALQFVRQEVEVTVKALRPVARNPYLAVPDNVKLRFEEGDVPDYWDLYEGHDVLLHPRRFGGQSLVLNEAASLGMPVIASRVPPQSEWLPPDCLIQARPTRDFEAPGGWISAYETDARSLAEAIDRFATEPDLVSWTSEQMDQYARGLDWRLWEPRYREMFAAIADDRRVRI